MLRIPLAAGQRVARRQILHSVPQRSVTSSSSRLNAAGTATGGARPTPTLTPPPKPTATASSTSQYSASSAASRQQPQIRDAVREALRDFDRRHTYRGHHLLNLLGAAAGGSIVVGALFYDDIIHWLSGQGSELARQTIQDEKLQQEVDRVTKVTTNALLNDPEVTEVTVEFLLRLLEKQETRATVVKFFSAVIADPSTANALAQLLKNPTTIQQLQITFNNLLKDPVIQQSLNVMVQNLLADPTTRKQFENLIVDLFNQKNVKSVVADFFGEVLRYDSVVTSATDSLRIVVENLSKDPETQQNLAFAGSQAVKRMVIPPFIFGRADNGPKKIEDDPNRLVETKTKIVDTDIDTKKEVEKNTEETTEKKAEDIADDSSTADYAKTAASSVSDSNEINTDTLEIEILNEEPDGVIATSQSGSSSWWWNR